MEKRYTALVKGKWSKKRHSIDAPLYQNSRCTVVDAKGKEALINHQQSFILIQNTLSQQLFKAIRGFIWL
jgi:23S rRNA-/tRNA-specific pseudouridylate synthase